MPDPPPDIPPGGAGSHAGPSRIIGSQAKKQEEVTRQGTQKMKFVPTLPIRRKKPDPEVKVDVSSTTTPSKPAERGRGRGQGVGRGRGAPAGPRPDVQMTASGPFAMGPALAGSSKKRTPRSNFTPIMPVGPGMTSLGEGLSHSGPPILNREKGKEVKTQVKEEEEDIEVYSDPDEGVQILDMDAIKTVDWMAPESLKRERNHVRKIKKKKEAEVVQKDVKEKGKAKAETQVEINLANALDLSESEDEEEMEDLIDDFANQDAEDEDLLTRQEKLYWFHFPQPFPTFHLPEEAEAANADAVMSDVQNPVVDGSKSDTSDKGKKVTFAQGVKPPAPNGSHDVHQKVEGSVGVSQETVTSDSQPEKKLDGLIGQLEVHRSGMIKMRLNNGMLMDVTAATQPSFLQQAVFLDPNAKKLHVLGEVNRRFVVSPDVDKLLEEIEKAENAERIKAETAQVPMDVDV